MTSSHDARLAQILRLHFDPAGGSRYWIEREKALGLSALREVRSAADLWKLGPMPLEDLASRPVDDFVPRKFLAAGRPRITAETGGATGTPKATVYFEDEFEAVFVHSFDQAARAAGFPEGGAWLWIGPGGPHIIGKAAMAIARRRSGTDAFSVDFDPRWYRSLAPGSIARRRYMNHLIDQAARVLRRERIRCLFATPVVLAALADAAEEDVRARIEGVYLGGMALEGAVMRKLADAFPRAVFVMGYGNTLFGVCHAAGDLKLSAGAVAYFPQGDRLCVRLVPIDDRLPDGERIRSEVPHGSEGQVMFHRLDESVFLPNVLERDRGIRAAATEAGRLAGFTGDGILNPGPLQNKLFTVDAGIY